MGTWSRFNIASIVLGFGFLYLPIVLLVIFSFNESKLVTVWAGFSTKWYTQLWHNQALLDAAWVTIRVALISATCATVLGRSPHWRSFASRVFVVACCFPAWSMRRS